MGKSIWVVLQQREGELHRLSWETVAAGQRLAEETGGSVELVLLGSGLEAVADQVASRVGAATLHVADHADLEPYTPGAYLAVLAPALEEAAPRYVLFPHTYQSLDFFPRLAQQTGGALIPGATGFRLEGGEVVWSRSLLEGKLQGEVKARRSPELVSIQSGAFSADAIQGGSTARQPLPVSGPLPRDREVLGVEQATQEQVDLSKAPIIVAAGRGVGGADKMAVVEELARALGAEIGASRPVIDNGWLPRDRQIGSSGQTVAPRLYIAAGVSGAIQHLVGMKGAGCVVAINKDANAPIFSVADYGIVGDLHEVLPALTAAIRQAKGKRED
jgi:electron transfer flavoprotein alpha subunit